MVIISGINSSWRQVTSRVLQWSQLGLISLNILITDLDDEADCILRKFADNTKLEGVADTTSGLCHHPEGPQQAGEMG